MRSHFSWLPRKRAIASASEALILRHNPQWGGKDNVGNIPHVAYTLDQHFAMKAMFWYDEEIAFTRETWRGRIRACRGTGATLSPHELAAFDEEHAALLENSAPPEFTVAHRIDAHFFVDKS
jgi:hypothetical protein